MGRTGMRTARGLAAASIGLLLLVGLVPSVAVASPAPTPTVEVPPSPEPAAAQAVEEAPGAAAQAATPTVVVGLGDSYASGEGAGPYDPGTDVPDGNMCHRSSKSWQRIVDVPGATGEQYVHVACSGAVAADIQNPGQYGEPPQVQELQRRTDEDVVLVSIGGNDFGFGPLLTACSLDEDECLATEGEVLQVEARIQAAQEQIRRALSAVVAASPGTTTVLAGYPQVVQGITCFGITADERNELDRLALVLRRVSVSAVMELRFLGHDVRFADTLDPFKGHGACNGILNQWINSGITGSPGAPEAFHPNETGYRAYATAVTGVLGADPMRCTSTGCGIRFQDESVYRVKGGATQVVTGPIRTAYEAQGEGLGPLGYPTSSQSSPLGGLEQRFTGGTVLYRTGATTAFWVGGKLLAKYESPGARGELGFPTSNAYGNLGATGQSQKFERGLMLLKNGASEAFWSKGAILAKYASTGYERGYLGYPKTDHACGLQPDNACRQHFDGSGDSVVYWTSRTGAHSITGYFRDFYASTGWQNSRPDPTTVLLAGYPTSDRYRPAGSTADLQDFEGGIMAGFGGRACWGVPNSDVCFAPTPPPKTVSNDKVGTILGAYAKAPQRDYGGYAYPAVEVGQCVVVERKTASGSWTTSGVTTGSPDRCNFFAWGIANDTAVSDTVAIRLRVSSGPNAPSSYVNLCSSKTECLAM